MVAVHFPADKAFFFVSEMSSSQIKAGHGIFTCSRIPEAATASGHHATLEQAVSSSRCKFTEHTCTGVRWVYSAVDCGPSERYQASSGQYEFGLIDFGLASSSGVEASIILSTFWLSNIFVQ